MANRYTVGQSFKWQAFRLDLFQEVVLFLRFLRQDVAKFWFEILKTNAIGPIGLTTKYLQKYLASRQNDIVWKSGTAATIFFQIMDNIAIAITIYAFMVRNTKYAKIVMDYFRR